ncbi:wiskott-Aldrich syndrome protein family member 2 [Austrofundulus limnaeus]|uniref:Wiskott-Aldrich syndrome protein family member 2 n=1 Tax=Austrofundulus limnaeus TaxID=52670 RepID=A0A2I4CTH0_AUSLI|nr:PREDICTED: wiskott-Aldrich syndrome protein family member 2-like [Austrofundulus limnaeus]
MPVSRGFSPHLTDRTPRPALAGPPPAPTPQGRRTGDGRLRTSGFASRVRPPPASAPARPPRPEARTVGDGTERKTEFAAVLPRIPARWAGSPGGAPAPHGREGAVRPRHAAGFPKHDVSHALRSRRGTGPGPLHDTTADVGCLSGAPASGPPPLPPAAEATWLILPVAYACLKV